MAGDIPEFGKSKVRPEWRVAIVRSLWHGELTKELSTTAMKRLLDSGLLRENIFTIEAPGSFELPLLTKTAFEKLGVDGAIVFGVIVDGQTHHAELVAREAGRGCMNLQLSVGKPVTFEILHVTNIEHAKARVFPPHGKGPLAADTLLTSLAKVSEMQR